MIVLSNATGLAGSFLSKSSRSSEKLSIEENACNLEPSFRSVIKKFEGRVPVNLKPGLLAALLLCFGISAPAVAQDAATEKAIERYRQMLKEDPWSNPGLLDSDRGEVLWATPRGPNKVSLEKCDLGKGPGVLDGAFAELPRYFADADRVMDVETRILWCMEKLQGFNRADLVKNPHPGGGQPVKELGAMATFVAHKSSGMKYTAKLAHPKERDAVALGEVLFMRRSGPFDFACASCHAEAGKRIRLQGLPFLSDPSEARKVVGEWPAYRVSSTHVMTMQHRLLDCYWQMRMPRLELGSEASVALIAYLTQTAAGGDIAAPGLKR
jgi:sulfur-oxidizing protein SoxA